MTRRLVIVLDYEVADLAGPALDRIAAVLHGRAVHETIEGARQVNAWAAVGETADRILDPLQSPLDREDVDDPG